MPEYYFALKGDNPQQARIISENRRNYILGFADGHMEDVSKKQGQKNLFVGDIVALSTEGNHERLHVVERKNKIQKASNTTAKSYHFSD